jgi:phospholipid/cholesterol/gamma-HCH transport system substrate-binding protein
MADLTTLTPRRQNALTGLIAVTLIAGLVTLGVKFSFGAFSDGYRLTGSFAAAGQGLTKNSDVKERGVNIGHVTGIKLVRGRALITMFIDAGQKVPKSAQAVIRPKTLFGEKFVDIVPGKLEASKRASDFYRDGDRIDKTLGGIELEKVLAEAYPILKAINPDELATVINTLADAADGQGPSINRQIVNTQKLLAVNAAHDADTQQFLTDLAALSDELATRAPDVVTAAKDLNQALPVINSRRGELTTLLEQASRLSGDAADILDANRDFLTKSVTEGGQTLNVLYQDRRNLVPTVTGVRLYLQTLVQSARLPDPKHDGTMMAAVKGILAGQLCPALPGCPTAAAPAPTAPAVSLPPLPPLPTLPPIPGVGGGGSGGGSGGLPPITTPTTLGLPGSAPSAVQPGARPAGYTAAAPDSFLSLFYWLLGA